jgi:NTE family protein
MYKCEIVITSDAGSNFFSNKNYKNTISLLVRTVDLFMTRIKNFQMARHLYGNTAGDGRPIAYFSLGWRIENCIPGFVSNMIEEKIPMRVIECHGFRQEWKDHPENYREEIKRHLELRTGFEAIMTRDISPSEWEIAKKVGTNLIPLKDDIVQLLIRQAENLTELQVKLYCPMLLADKVPLI